MSKSIASLILISIFTLYSCEDSQLVFVKIHNNTNERIDSMVITSLGWPVEYFDIDSFESYPLKIDCQKIYTQDTCIRIEYKHRNEHKQLAFGQIRHGIPQNKLYILRIDDDKILLRSNR